MNAATNGISRNRNGSTLRRNTRLVNDGRRSTILDDVNDRFRRFQRDKPSAENRDFLSRLLSNADSTRCAGAVNTSPKSRIKCKITTTTVTANPSCSRCQSTTYRPETKSVRNVHSCCDYATDTALRSRAGCTPRVDYQLRKKPVSVDPPKSYSSMQTTRMMPTSNLRLSSSIDKLHLSHQNSRKSEYQSPYQSSKPKETAEKPPSKMHSFRETQPSKKDPGHMIHIKNSISDYAKHKQTQKDTKNGNVKLFVKNEFKFYDNEGKKRPVQEAVTVDFKKPKERSRSPLPTYRGESPIGRFFFKFGRHRIGVGDQQPSQQNCRPYHDSSKVESSYFSLEKPSTFIEDTDVDKTLEESVVIVSNPPLTLKRKVTAAAHSNAGKLASPSSTSWESSFTFISRTSSSSQTLQSRSSSTTSLSVSYISSTLFKLMKKKSKLKKKLSKISQQIKKSAFMSKKNQVKPHATTRVKEFKRESKVAAASPERRSKDRHNSSKRTPRRELKTVQEVNVAQQLRGEKSPSPVVLNSARNRLKLASVYDLRPEALNSNPLNSSRRVVLAEDTVEDLSDLEDFIDLSGLNVSKGVVLNESQSRPHKLSSDDLDRIHRQRPQSSLKRTPMSDVVQQRTPRRLDNFHRPHSYCQEYRPAEAKQSRSVEPSNRKSQPPPQTRTSNEGKNSSNMNSFELDNYLDDLINKFKLKANLISDQLLDRNQTRPVNPARSQPTHAAAPQPQQPYFQKTNGKLMAPQNPSPSWRPNPPVEPVTARPPSRPPSKMEHVKKPASNPASTSTSTSNNHSAQLTRSYTVNQKNLLNELTSKIKSRPLVPEQASEQVQQMRPNVPPISVRRAESERNVAEMRRQQYEQPKSQSNSNTSNVSSDEVVVMPKGGNERTAAATARRQGDEQGQDNTTSLINFTYSYELDDEEDENGGGGGGNHGNKEEEDDESTLNGDNSNEGFSAPLSGENERHRRSEEGYVAGEIINMNFDEMSDQSK